MEASAYVDGRCTDNTFNNNYINGAAYGVYQSEADSSNYLGNTFVDTGDNEWEDGDDLLWKARDCGTCFLASPPPDPPCPTI